jgi:hypothetical protein
MATLIYSDKCRLCFDVVEYIKTQESLHSVVSYHHIRDGIPDGITRVPSLITGEELLVGKSDILKFLESIVPKPKLGGVKQNLFKFADYGKMKQPIMTEEFKARTEMKIEDAIANLKG